MAFHLQRWSEHCFGCSADSQFDRRKNERRGLSHASEKTTGEERRTSAHTVIGGQVALRQDMSSDTASSPPVSPRTKSLRELVESSEYPSYPSPPRESMGLARHCARGMAKLPSTTLFEGLVLLLVLFLAVMAGIFFVERSPGIGLAFTAAVAALVYGRWRVNRRQWA